jgi:hypothetical protein
MPSQIWITVLCQLCGDKLDNRRTQDGKAYCEDCDYMIFDSAPSVRSMPTFDELLQERKDKEKEIFLKFMSRLYRKLRY